MTRDYWRRREKRGAHYDLTLMRGVWAIVVLLVLVGFLGVLAQLAHAQRQNVRYAAEYPGATVAARVTAAQADCNPNASIPCVIVIDATLATASEGTLPTPCAQCIWKDYRVAGSERCASNASPALAACGGGGGGTPGSPVNSLQFNSAGNFGGSSSLLWQVSSSQGAPFGIGLNLAGVAQYAPLQIGDASPTTALGGVQNDYPRVTVSENYNSADNYSRTAFADTSIYNNCSVTCTAYDVSFSDSAYLQQGSNHFGLSFHPQVAPAAAYGGGLLGIDFYPTVGAGGSAPHIYGIYARGIAGTGTLTGTYALISQQPMAGSGVTFNGKYFWTNDCGTCYSYTIATAKFGGAAFASFTDAVEISGSAGTDGSTNAGHLAFTGGKGQHIKTQSAGNDIAGTVTVSASTTASITFTTAYTAAPVCVLTPQTTGLTSWYLSAIATTGFTVTVAPSGTYTFGYICMGNPN